MTLDLSIIIPIYNCGDYIEVGLKSLLPLWNSNIQFEVICVNDGSTDNSASELERLSKEYDNLIVINQENQGSSGARNTGINIAKGQYILFLDADDTINTEVILKSLTEAKQLDLDLISFRLQRVNEKGDVLGVMNVFNHYNQLLTGADVLIKGYQPSSICVYLMKTSFLNDHNLRITPKITHMDVEFTSRIMVKAQRCYFIEDIGYNYLLRSGSITQAKTQEKLETYLFDEIIVADNIRNTISYEMSKELKIAIQKNYNSVVWNFLWYLRNHKDKLSKEFMNKSLNFLKERKLFPIKGPLKTKFQKLSSIYLKYYFYINN